MINTILIVVMALFALINIILINWAVAERKEAMRLKKLWDAMPKAARKNICNAK